MSTVSVGLEGLRNLPTGSIVWAVHPVFGGGGLAAILRENVHGDKFWEVTGEDRSVSTFDLFDCVRGVPFVVLHRGVDA